VGHLSVAPLLGELRALALRVKGVQGANTPAYFGIIFNGEEKSFSNICTLLLVVQTFSRGQLISRHRLIWGRCYKTFYGRNFVIFVISYSVCARQAFLA
jgi:hypothetical protein